MNPFAQLDDHFARQFGGLPQIDPPVLHLSKGVHAPAGEWKEPKSPVAPGLAVTEYRLDGLLLGNADIAINNRESVEGICVEDEK